MTKEEFLSMFHKELENLKQEWLAASQTVDNLTRTKSDKLRPAMYQVELIRQNFETLSSLIHLPTYARIQAMSDIEIEAYKREKAREFDLKIKETEEKEEKAVEKLVQLKAEKESLEEKYYLNNSNEVFYRKRQLDEQINAYSNPNVGVIVSFHQEKMNIQKEKETMQAMTSEEIKQQLSSKIEKSSYLAKKMEESTTPTSSFERFEEYVATNPEKADRLAVLLAQYGGIWERQQECKAKKHLYRLPELLQNSKNFRLQYDSNTNEINDSDLLIRAIEEFEPLLSQAKKTYMEQFTEQKLHKFVTSWPHGLEYQRDTEENKVDMEFLQQHVDKLDKGEFDALQRLVEQRENLSKKLLKTDDTKEKMETLNHEINQRQEKLYQEILKWYEKQKEYFKSLFGSSFEFSSILSKGNLESVLEDYGKLNFETTEKAIAEAKKDIQEGKRKLEEERQRYEQEKEKILQQIRSLGGDKFQDVEIPSYIATFHNVDALLNQLIHTANHIYQKKMINQVQHEAQQQAHTKEIELKSMAMEEQTKEIFDEQEFDVNENEESHGIKR